MVKGTPIQILMQIIVIFASSGSVKKGMDSVAPRMPKSLKSTFTGPFALKIVLMVSRVTN